MRSYCYVVKVDIFSTNTLKCRAALLGETGESSQLARGQLHGQLDLFRNVFL